MISITHTYDKVGNRKSCVIDNNSAAAYVYDYDEIYRLIFVDYNDGFWTDYDYDSLGNRTEVNDTGISYLYASNNLNQYTSVDGNSYTYNSNGCLSDDGAYYKYYYDCESRLTDVNDQSNNPIASYEYDYLGRRVSKTVDSNTTKYCYDGDQVIAEYENDTLVRKFIYGPGIDEPICMIDVSDSNKKYYYHFDGVGSVVALSKENREIVERYSYDAFGEPNRTSDLNNPYYFTGRRLDTETHLYYYRARYYAYDIGRFLQVDPIGYDDGLNMYAYVSNNPVSFVDPFGLCKDSDEAKIKQLEEYIKSAEAALIANMEVLKSLHTKISSTHSYYQKVLIANTALSVFTTTKTAIKIAGGLSNIGSATKSLGTNLIQEMTYGPGKDVGLANLGGKLVSKGANDFIKIGLINTAVVVPATKLTPKFMNIELSIAGAKQKMVTKYEKQAQKITNNINSLSQGISQAMQTLRSF